MSDRITVRSLLEQKGQLSDDVVAIKTDGKLVDLHSFVDPGTTFELVRATDEGRRVRRPARAPHQQPRRGEAHQRRRYGTAFASQEALDEHLKLIEEAKARDHRKLGKELDLFLFDPVAPAMPFFLPRGAHIYNTLVEYMRVATEAL